MRIPFHRVYHLLDQANAGRWRLVFHQLEVKKQEITRKEAEVLKEIAERQKNEKVILRIKAYINKFQDLPKSLLDELQEAPLSKVHSQIQISDWEEIYQWLENKRFDVNRVDEIEGKTLLEYIEHKNIRSELRKRGALTASEKAFKGAKENNWDIVFDCLSKHAVEPHSVNPLGLPTLLDYAVQHDNLKAIARLLYYPLSPNIAYQRFAFLAAKAKAWKKVFRMLDQELMEITARDELGKTLIDYALNETDVLEWKKFNALQAFKAAYQGEWDLVWEYLEKGQLELSTTQAFTHFTLSDFAYCQENLDAYLRLNFYRFPEKTALKQVAFIAAQWGYWDQVMAFLRSKHVDVDDSDPRLEFKHYSLMDYAKNQKNKEIIDLLQNWKLQKITSKLAALEIDNHEVCQVETISPCITPGLDRQSPELKQPDDVQRFPPFDVEETSPAERSGSQHFFALK